MNFYLVFVVSKCTKFLVLTIFNVEILVIFNTLIIAILNIFLEVLIGIIFTEFAFKAEFVVELLYLVVAVLTHISFCAVLIFT